MIENKSYMHRKVHHGYQMMGGGIERKRREGLVGRRAHIPRYKSSSSDTQRLSNNHKIVERETQIWGLEYRSADSFIAGNKSTNSDRDTHILVARIKEGITGEKGILKNMCTLEIKITPCNK